MNPLVSIIMPVFNASTYLNEAIDSLLVQTFEDFELIILNDGSTDDSCKIVEAYDDIRIKFINRAENKGLIYTLNEGLQVAKGKYIARMDADDVCHPKRLEVQTDYLNQHPTISLCGTWAYQIDNNGKVTRNIRKPVDDKYVFINLFFTSPLIHPTIMAKRELFETYQFDPAAKYFEDLALWFDAGTQGQYAMVNIPEYLFYYRWHDSNVSVIHHEEQIKSSRKMLWEKIQGQMPELSNFDAHFATFLKEYRHVPMRDLLNHFSQLTHALVTHYPLKTSTVQVFILSRLLTYCVVRKKITDIFRIPLKYWRPKTVYGAVQLMKQK